jgi:hypothetical protein
MAVRRGNPQKQKKDRLFKDLTSLSTNPVDKLWKSMLMIFLIGWLSIPSTNCPNNRQFL